VKLHRRAAAALVASRGEAGGAGFPDGSRAGPRQSVCWVGAPDDVRSPVRAEPGQQLRELRRVEPVQGGVRGRELDEVTPTGREMQFSPVDDDGATAATSSSPWVRAPRAHLRPGRGGDRQGPRPGCRGRPRQAAVPDPPSWVWRCGVRREPHSVDRKTHLLVVVGPHQPPRQQVMDATLLPRCAGIWPSPDRPPASST
jgi:hypothetical protein